MGTMDASGLKDQVEKRLGIKFADIINTGGHGGNLRWGELLSDDGGKETICKVSTLHHGILKAEFCLVLFVFNP